MAELIRCATCRAGFVDAPDDTCPTCLNPFVAAVPQGAAPTAPRDDAQPAQGSLERTCPRCDMPGTGTTCDGCGAALAPARRPVRLTLPGGAVVPLAEGSEVVLGRSSSNVAVANALSGFSGVSRRHASLRCSGSLLELTDFGSTNGTFVDGVPVEGTRTWEATAVASIRLGGSALLEVSPEEDSRE